ncbi:hypothetical protein JN06_02276 [Bacteroides zoogleoformans]|nr:hypothetical protein JN06_02276 [Bacteroides zoogleoformans]
MRLKIFLGHRHSHIFTFDILKMLTYLHSTHKIIFNNFLVINMACIIIIFKLHSAHFKRDFSHHNWTCNNLFHRSFRSHNPTTSGICSIMNAVNTV